MIDLVYHNLRVPLFHALGHLPRSKRTCTLKLLELILDHSYTARMDRDTSAATCVFPLSSELPSGVQARVQYRHRNCSCCRYQKSERIHADEAVDAAKMVPEVLLFRTCTVSV